MRIHRVGQTKNVMIKRFIVKVHSFLNITFKSYFAGFGSALYIFIDTRCLVGAGPFAVEKEHY